MLLAALLASPLALAEPLHSVLDTHNQHRAAAAQPRLEWDDALAQSAAAHAAALSQAGELTAGAEAVGQRIGDVVVVGENVSAGRTADAAAARWFAEQDTYEAGACEPDTEAYASCGHYATAVAAYALRLGCGWAGEVLVCRYGSP